MNKVVLVGRLARDPELRVTQSGTNVTSFTVACDRHGVRRNSKRSADGEHLIQPFFQQGEQGENWERTSTIHNKEGEERQADFINCVAWNKTAEFVSRYFKKGMRIALDGRIQTRSYDDQNGNKRHITEVIAEDVEFAQSKNEGNGSYQAPAYSAPVAPQADVSGFVPIEDEDLPF